ncbi:MAG TPA: GNAT family N-acetyltransferase [Streptosporangiaceae bacterium]|nr:GNAT family N-acetyltransferase [Streptosporangiaceae bacterium]
MSGQPDQGVYALLADGTTVEIREAGAGDFDAVRDMHRAMSPDNTYLRFFSMSKAAADREASRICREPAADHVALLAWLAGELIGVASYEGGGRPAAPEIAFAVADHAHHRGVATLLLEHLVSAARSRGVRTFTAEVLAENAAMLQVFVGAGLRARRRLVDDVTELSFDLPGHHADPGWEPYLEAVADRESRADAASLRHVLAAESVAVIGASRRQESVGRAILRNIVTGGYGGRVYAVNPHANELEGVACVPSPATLPGPVDLAVISVPAPGVLDVAEECGKRGIGALVVVTSGLDAAARAALLACCRRHGMRLVGPNCFGVAVPGVGLDATFGARHPAAGVAGLAVQSGGVGIALLDQLTRLGIGVSSFTSLGDKSDVSGNDLLMWWEQDPATTLALLYLESLGNPRKFGRIARHVGASMPVLTVDAGRSEAGQRAAASHTAAAASPVVTREALFGQAGVIATRDIGELIEAAALLASQPVPAGGRIAIVSNAGGAGVLAADACADAGLHAAVLGDQVQGALRRLLPSGAEVAGPVDTTAAVPPDVFRRCLELAATDDGVDAVLALTVPTAMGDLVSAACAAAVSKPLTLSVLSQAEAVRLLPGGPEASGPVPAYAYPGSAARALAHAARYGAWRGRVPGQIPAFSDLRPGDARALVGAFLERQPDGGWLPPDQTAELLTCYGIPLVSTWPVTSEEAAVAAAAQLGSPVVLKADVPGLVHKTDAGALQLDLHGPDEVRAGYRALAERFGTRMTAGLIQPMVTGGTEVIIGVVQEPVFGPLVVFGLGGVATDVLGDRSARLTPLTDTDAAALVRSIRAAPLLLGHRGTQAADLAALQDVLMRVSRLADDVPQVAELDLNPVIARADGAHVVDTRVRIVPAEPADPYLRRLR